MVFLLTVFVSLPLLHAVPGTSGARRPVLWSFDARGPVRSTPVISGDVLYIGSDGAYVFALKRQTGEIKWHFKTGSAVSSVPLFDSESNHVFVTSKKGTLHALHAANGEMSWSFDTKAVTRYAKGWDYFISSPALAGKRGNLVIFGSGDNFIYAINKKKGTLAWNYDAGDMVRSTPTVVGDTVYCGTMKGELLALSVKKGKRKWVFKAKGNKYFPKGEFLFKPLVHNGMVFAGSRDASFYALDAATGAMKWKVTDPMGAWYTTAIAEGDTVFAASSDGHYIQALDVATGKEKWQCKSDDLVFSTPAFHNSVVYFGGHDDYIYAANAKTGDIPWRYRTGGDVLGSPVVDNNILYIGGDDGKLYAIDISKDKAAAASMAKGKTAFRAVYYAPRMDKKVHPVISSLPQEIYSRCRDEGFQRLDGPGLETFLNERIKNKQAASSAVVLASYTYPYSVMQSVEGSPSLVRQYLDGGGTFLWIGNLAPFVATLKPETKKDKDNKEIKDEVFFRAFKETMTTLGINQTFLYNSAFYYDSYVSHATEAGKKLGLPDWFSAGYGVDPKQVSTVLAMDEHGRATAWIKNYGGPDGTGLIRIWAGDRLSLDITSITDAIF